MDGTLVDTEPYWLAAERALVESFGGTWSERDGFALVGAGLKHTAGALKDKGVDLTHDDIIDRLTGQVLDQAKTVMPWRPGAVELLRALHDKGIPMALVTMSMRPLAEYVATGLDFAPFQAIVTGGDVANAKPHPEPYLRAAELLQVKAGDCVAIEDSVPGLTSATASGAVTIGVPAHVLLPPSESYTLWPTLTGRTLKDLADVFTAERVTSGVQR